MKVVVEILTGNFFYVHVREDGTVGDLRRAISEQQKLPIDRLMLVLMLIEDDVIWLVMNEDEGEKSNLSLTKCGVHDGSHMNKKDRMKVKLLRILFHIPILSLL
ncbi:hypothetical protein LINPERPRIM_LOCUS1847 [Linum perenne]